MMSARWWRTLDVACCQAPVHLLPDSAQGAVGAGLTVGCELVASAEAVFLLGADGEAQAALVLTSPLYFTQRARLADVALKHRVPTMFGAKENVEAGGLMSYGADLKDLFRRAATYVDKILKGATPADLPVEQPTKFELIINLKTAQALGLTMPPHLLMFADEVIK